MADDEPEDIEEETEHQAVDGLTDIGGVGEDTAGSLREAGYETVEDLREASQDDLAAVDGVGTALAARVKAEVGDVEVSDDADAADVGQLLGTLVLVFVRLRFCFSDVLLVCVWFGGVLALFDLGVGVV